MLRKYGHDIRSFVVDEECITAIYWTSLHWITKAALGAVATACMVTDEISYLSLALAKAVGGGMFAADLFDTTEKLMVNEVNYTMEFRNSIDINGENIPARMVEYVLENAL